MGQTDWIEKTDVIVKRENTFTQKGLEGCFTGWKAAWVGRLLPCCMGWKAAHLLHGLASYSPENASLLGLHASLTWTWTWTWTSCFTGWTAAPLLHGLEGCSSAAWVGRLLPCFTGWKAAPLLHGLEGCSSTTWVGRLLPCCMGWKAVPLLLGFQCWSPIGLVAYYLQYTITLTDQPQMAFFIEASKDC